MYLASVLSPCDSPGISVTIRQNRSEEDFVSVANIGDARYYAVFDGHGGKKGSSMDKHVAVFMKDYFHYFLAHELSCGSDVESSVVSAFVRVDRELYKRKYEHGTTCGIVLVFPETVFQINLGDSGSVVFDGRCSVVSKTTDHVPNEEKRRIVRAGGFVRNGRVNGILATSRSIGDYELKAVNGKYSPEGPVSCVPTILSLPRKKGLTLLLGTDGMHNGCSLEKMSKILLASSLRDSSQNIYEAVRSNNHDDDVTILVVHV